MTSVMRVVMTQWRSSRDALRALAVILQAGDEPTLPFATAAPRIAGRDGFADRRRAPVPWLLLEAVDALAPHRPPLPVRVDGELVRGVPQLALHVGGQHPLGDQDRSVALNSVAATRTAAVGSVRAPRRRHGRRATSRRSY